MTISPFPHEAFRQLCQTCYGKAFYGKGQMSNILSGRCLMQCFRPPGDNHLLYLVPLVLALLVCIIIARHQGLVGHLVAVGESNVAMYSVEKYPFKADRLGMVRQHVARQSSFGGKYNRYSTIWFKPLGLHRNWIARDKEWQQVCGNSTAINPYLKPGIEALWDVGSEIHQSVKNTESLSRCVTAAQDGWNAVPPLRGPISSQSSSYTKATTRE